MDCVRTAIRAGAREAICIYRRDLDNMPAAGVNMPMRWRRARVFFLTNPVALSRNGRNAVVEAVASRWSWGSRMGKAVANHAQFQAQNSVTRRSDLDRLRL